MASKRSGFTLIELIVVMAIMAVLTAAFVSTYQTSRIKGKDSKRKGDLRQIQNALDTYLNDHNVYPSSQAGVIVACGGGGNSACNWGSAFTDQNGTVYMAQLPTDTSAPTEQYYYVASSNQKMYQLFAALDNDQDTSYHVYSQTCGTVPCTYGVSSGNTTPTAVLP